MAEERKEPAPSSRKYSECALNWLKVVDDWSIGGYDNRLPRMYYVTAALLILVILI
jgi:hypothetical protein